ncbi:hypothetical protein DFJ74DRAFT_704974 [Hyaloraphidium curvatum]|nr:hypothetical protein DFJ74DRAFT_704974 [Hyaloraphidium curvatum]
MNALTGQAASVPCPPEPEVQRGLSEKAPAVPSPVFLPAEILLHIMKQLDWARKKKSLLSVLSTCRFLLTLGMRVLVRKLQITPLYKGQMGKWRGLLSDGLHLGKLQMVRELSISIESDPFVQALLRNVAPTILKLELDISDLPALSNCLPAIRTSNALRSVCVSYDRNHDFEEFEVHSLVSWNDFIMDNFSWPGAILEFPTVAAKLRRLTFNMCELDDWTAAAEDLRRIRAAFPGLQDLTLDLASTSILAGCEWTGLQRIFPFSCSDLDMPHEAFPAVRAAIKTSSTLIIIDPAWDALFEGRGLTLSQVNAMDIEEDYWLEIEELYWLDKKKGVVYHQGANWDEVRQSVTKLHDVENFMDVNGANGAAQ